MSEQEQVITELAVSIPKKKPRNEKNVRRIIYTDEMPFIPDYEIGGVPVMRIAGVKYRNENGALVFAEFPWYADKDGYQRRASRTRPRIKINPYLRDHLTPVVKEKAVHLTVEQMYTVISCLRSHGWGVPRGIAEGMDGTVATLLSDGTVRVSVPANNGGCAVYVLKVPDKFIFEVMHHDYAHVS